MTEPPLKPWRRGARNRLSPRDLQRFPSDSLFDVLGRTLSEASCFPRKELYESWAVARKILRRHRGGPVLDLAGGHGLVAWLMLLLDPTTPSATVVDRSLPQSAHRLAEALAVRWPDITSRWNLVEGELTCVSPTKNTRVIGIHACGALTDRVLDIALEHGSRVAVLPCCHSKAKLDDGGLQGWMPHDVAVDTLRAHRLRTAGYTVHTTTLPEDITPKNRVLLGTPPATVTTAP